MRRSRKIVMCLEPAISHYNAAIGLANVLARRGHIISFVGANIPQLIRQVKTQGFDYIPVASKSNAAPSAAVGATERRHNAILTFYGDFVWRSARNKEIADDIARILLDIRPDLVILDFMITFPAAIPVAILKSDIPTILLAPNYSSRFSLEYPPVFSARVPGAEGEAAWRSKTSNFIDWTKTLLLGPQSNPSVLKRLMQTSLLHVTQWRSLRELRNKGGRISFSEWWQYPDLPSIVMGYRDLDWPDLAADPRRFYFTGLSASRTEQSFDWSKIVEGKPLIYIQTTTMQTKANIFARARRADGDFRKASEEVAPHLMRYLRVTCDAFAARPDLQVVLSCGALAELFQEGLPANVHVYDHVAQLDILRRAALVITQGGAGTVRECINQGVPMLVFPGYIDQFGNAARIRYHGIGAAGSMMHVTSGELIEMVDRMLRDKSVASSMARIREAHDADREPENLCQFIERHTSVAL